MRSEFFLRKSDTQAQMLITLESCDEIAEAYAALKLVDAEIQSTPLLRRMISSLEAGMMYSPKVKHHAAERVTR